MMTIMPGEEHVNCHAQAKSTARTGCTSCLSNQGHLMLNSDKIRVRKRSNSMIVSTRYTRLRETALVSSALTLPLCTPR